ncbi:hypothetical protein [Actinomadura sp. 9N407]|uniref:hypothetical protein n=1 Tax=Actinomadura sp. 9N407 TaxID=3375154 RepID=UPI0037BD82F3
MRDLRRPALRRPVLPEPPPSCRDERGRLARLLIIALGLVGFVAAPAAGAPAAGAGAFSGVRAGAPQAGPNAPGARPDGSSTRQRTHPADRATVAAAAARQQALAQATAPALAVPPPGTAVRPPSRPAARLLPASHEPPAVPAAGGPRGRAPPPST